MSSRVFFTKHCPAATIRPPAPAARLRSRHSRRVRVQTCAQAEESALSSIDQVPAGCSRYSTQLTRPLGMVLETNAEGEFMVVEVLGGGNAERDGNIVVGDKLISCSGIVFTREQEYQENIVKSGESRITMNVRGEKFDTVMACLQTHRAGIPVDLTFQRC